MSSNLRAQDSDAAARSATKQEWVAPAISTFEAIGVTKGISFRIGDGINNLS